MKIIALDREVFVGISIKNMFEIFLSRRNAEDGITVVKKNLKKFFVLVKKFRKFI